MNETTWKHFPIYKLFMSQIIKLVLKNSSDCFLIACICLFTFLSPQELLYAQTQNNYTYDNEGRLTSDLSQGIVKITWNNMARVTQITRADTSRSPDLEFAYDAK